MKAKQPSYTLTIHGKRGKQLLDFPLYDVITVMPNDPVLRICLEKYQDKTREEDHKWTVWLRMDFEDEVTNEE
jgi:hypothetical protein